MIKLSTKEHYHLGTCVSLSKNTKSALFPQENVLYSKKVQYLLPWKNKNTSSGLTVIVPFII
jgi:hypothetical protein